MYKPLKVELRNVYGLDESLEAMRLPKQSVGDSKSGVIGPEDAKLAKRLIMGGDDHAKAMRGVLAYIYLEMQVGWLLQFETYRYGVECLSTSSSMHGELRLLFDVELAEQKQADLSEKVYKRILFISYQTLRRMYLKRRSHRHPDWKIFCSFIESLPYFNQLIIPEHKLLGIQRFEEVKNV